MSAPPVIQEAPGEPMSLDEKRARLVNVLIDRLHLAGPHELRITPGRTGRWWEFQDETGWHLIDREDELLRRYDSDLRGRAY